MRVKVKRGWIWATLLALTFVILSPQIVSHAAELGGYLSEVLISRISSSDILVDRAGVGNSSIDIGYAPPVITLPATDIGISGVVTHATLQGQVVSVAGFPFTYGWFEWGYNTSYGNIVGNQTVGAAGTYLTTITHYNNDIVHYRFVSQADGTNYYGGDIAFQIQSPAASMPPWIPVIFVLMVIITILIMLAAGLPPVLVVIMALILGVIGVIGAAILAGLLGAMI